MRAVCLVSASCLACTYLAHICLRSVSSVCLHDITLRTGSPVGSRAHDYAGHHQPFVEQLRRDDEHAQVRRETTEGECSPQLEQRRQRTAHRQGEREHVGGQTSTSAFIYTHPLTESFPEHPDGNTTLSGCDHVWMVAVAGVGGI